MAVLTTGTLYVVLRNHAPYSSLLFRANQNFSASTLGIVQYLYAKDRSVNWGDFTWSLLPFSFWQTYVIPHLGFFFFFRSSSPILFSLRVQIQVGVICACLITLRPLWCHILELLERHFPVLNNHLTGTFVSWGGTVYHGAAVAQDGKGKAQTTTPPEYKNSDTSEEPKSSQNLVETIA